MYEVYSLKIVSQKKRPDSNLSHHLTALQREYRSLDALECSPFIYSPEIYFYFVLSFLNCNIDVF